MRNLFAHVDTKYEFNQNVCTVIFGENRDDDDSDNNGAGKSTIFEAIAIALTGKSLRDIDKEVFINRHSESCEVEMYLENTVLNSTLGIVRKFYRGGKSAKVEVYEDGEQNKQLVSVNDANARIIDLIGITRDDLLRYFIISQDNRYQFFTAGDAEKKEVLNRITNADMIKSILDKLSSDKKRLSADASGFQTDIDKYESKLEIYQEQRKEVFAKDNSDEISKKQKRIKELNDKIKESENSITDAEKRLVKLRSSDDYKLISNVSDVSELENRRKNIRNKIKQLESDEREAEQIIANLKRDLSGSVECPECGHEFIPKSNYDMSIDSMKETIKETELSLSDIKSQISVQNDKLKKVNEKISKSEKDSETASRAKSKERSIQREIEDYRGEIKSYQGRIKTLQSEIKDLKENTDSAKLIKDYDDKISAIEKEIAEKREQMTAVSNELAMVDYWIYYMGRAGFQTYLANRAVKIIEGITNSFLNRFHSSMTVEVNGFRVNKDGTVRDKIDVMAVYKGMYAQNFMGYSGGERSRIYLASILGIQHLINLSTNGKGLSLLLLDECLNNVDSRGVVNICNILNNLGVTILMITQNISNDVNINNKILVVREDEVARIEN